MKKYVKPELFYEHFELSTHIADCVFEHVNGNEPEDCMFMADENSGMYGHMVFITENVCDWPLDHSCYYPGTDGTNTFNS